MSFAGVAMPQGQQPQPNPRQYAYGINGAIGHLRRRNDKQTTLSRHPRGNLEETEEEAITKAQAGEGEFLKFAFDHLGEFAAVPIHKEVSNE